MYYCTGKLLPLIYLCKKCHLYTDTPNLQPAMSNNTCTSSIPSPIQPTSSNRTTKRKLDFCSTKNLTKRLRKKSLGLYMHVFMNYNITLVSIVDLTDNNPVILTGDGNTPWLRKNFAFTLFLSDKKSITDGKWISDAVINAGQQLLKEANPNISSLQPPILSKTLQSYEAQKSQFVQVLHINENHWITVSNIGCLPNYINIFDSLPHTGLSAQARIQISCLLSTKEAIITSAYQCVQQQHGTQDCGLFSLAFATSLCFGENPAEIIYIQNQFRPHLLNCLTVGKMTPFPSQKRKRKLKAPRFIDTIEVFCICRQPERGPMIECLVCTEWFHKDCVQASDEAWTHMSYNWICPNCCPSCTCN